MRMLTSEEFSRFSQRHTAVLDDSCWNWTSTMNSEGYGMLSMNGKLIRAHRISFRMFRGELLHGMEVCHRCDNRLCVRPSHLFLGTHKDNMQDMFKKNRRRTVRGEASGRAKLTEEQVKQIRESSDSHAVLARKFGVYKATVTAIKTRRSWAWLA